MHRFPLFVRTFILTVALVLSSLSEANAAELKVFASVALTSTFNGLAPAFEAATGNKLAIAYGLAAEL